MNDADTNRRLDTHITACDALRRLLIRSALAIVAVNVVIVVFVTAQTFTIKGRQDGVLAWRQTVERQLASDRETVGQRIGAVVSANIQREVTFGDRFKSIEAEIAAIRRELFETRLLQPAAPRIGEAGAIERPKAAPVE